MAERTGDRVLELVPGGDCLRRVKEILQERTGGETALHHLTNETWAQRAADLLIEADKDAHPMRELVPYRSQGIEIEENPLAHLEASIIHVPAIACGEIPSLLETSLHVKFGVTKGPANIGDRIDRALLDDLHIDFRTKSQAYCVEIVRAKANMTYNEVAAELRLPLKNLAPSQKDLERGSVKPGLGNHCLTETIAFYYWAARAKSLPYGYYACINHTGSGWHNISRKLNTTSAFLLRRFRKNDAFFHTIRFAFPRGTYFVHLKPLL